MRLPLQNPTYAQFQLSDDVAGLSYPRDPRKPIDHYTPAQQHALRVAMKGRVSGRALHQLSAVELIELTRTDEYRQALG